MFTCTNKNYTWSVVIQILWAFMSFVLSCTLSFAKLFVITGWKTYHNRRYCCRVLKTSASCKYWFKMFIFVPYSYKGGSLICSCSAWFNSDRPVLYYSSEFIICQEIIFLLTASISWCHKEVSCNISTWCRSKANILWQSWGSTLKMGWWNDTWRLCEAVDCCRYVCNTNSLYIGMASIMHGYIRAESFT